MKLIKIKIRDTGLEYDSYILTGLRKEFIGKYETFVRTTRKKNIKTIIDTLNKCDNPYDFASDKFQLSNHEEIIFELEFEKLEDLVELIPEEFL